MRINVLLIFILLLSQYAAGQPTYAKVIIYATSDDLSRLAEAGVAVDHGKFKRDNYIVTDVSYTDLAIADSLGLDYEVLIKDVVSWYRKNLHAHDQTIRYFGDPHLKQLKAAGCGSSGTPITNYPTPVNFSSGSMGGYLTYAEFLENLDSMASLFPTLISPRQPIDSSGIPFLTHDSNPLYWVRISDNPNTDESTEPEILYTAIHHAREPASLSQLIFYMWYLLENYGSDPYATYVVDNMELYFVPMVNPDGYLYNELISPGGGGMWRKNRRNNGGSYGVDLNRNYSYQWGVSGASTNPNSDTYMGPNPFSEPETRAIRKFCQDRDLRIAQNAHTHGNLLLHPFGYAVTQTSDHALYSRWTKHMVEQNGFTNMLSALLYPAAGDSDDWMYAGDLGTKPKILAMTPEIGADIHGFWPPTGEIVPICKEMVFENLTAAFLTWKYGMVEDASPFIIDGDGFLKYTVERLGMESGNLTVSIAPVGFGIASVGSANTHTLNNILDTESDSIAFTLAPGLNAGQTFQFELSISNGIVSWKDTITKVYGSPQVVYANNGNSMTDWNSASWNITGSDYYSPSSSITDSPTGNYNNAANTSVTLNSTIDLSNAVAASISFFAKWDIEDGFDYCQFQVSDNNGSTWTPMCGKYTEAGTADQDEGEPLWDGTQTAWVQEEIDLNDFLGSDIQVRFRLRSDFFVTGDGFYFDDFEIRTISSVGLTGHEINLLPCMPNPATDHVFIPFLINADAILEVYSTTGKLMDSYALKRSDKQIRINTTDYSSGIYYYRISSLSQSSDLRRFAITK